MLSPVSGRLVRRGVVGVADAQDERDLLVGGERRPVDHGVVVGFRERGDELLRPEFVVVGGYGLATGGDGGEFSPERVGAVAGTRGVEALTAAVPVAALLDVRSACGMRSTARRR
jgi:hypothetical protein